ncbi:MAG: L,D-transpeptidase family protein, partial [Proteobacteria bacterium]|nr:L,D-transpeptidase family protein [Pseudomonadota bacterium]
PEDYHLAEIEERIRQLRQGVARENQADAALCFLELDLLLTDAYLTYAADLKTGRVENPKWHAHILEEDLSELLQNAVNAGRIEPSLKDLLPKHENYDKLAKVLARYRTVSYGGGWGFVQEGPTMRLGDRDDRVKSLRARLLISDDYEGSLAGDLALFDEDLLEAVKKFQLRHGLEPDGLVGKKTLEELNVPVEERIKQIKVNMERWRWLPNLLGDRYILVNIANFQTDVVEGTTTVLTMKSIVGREFRHTPVFSDKMTYLVLNPYWNVPLKLAVEDIIPQVRKDPGYLAKNHMKVLKGWGAGEYEIDPNTIDWWKMNEDNFPYRFRQDPGPYNALGRIKFMFPNEHAVYIHDTPAKGLFKETSRDLSSGCIRIDKPLKLAEYLLSEDPAWDLNRIVEELDTKVDLSVRLPRPINIHILYWTTWIDERGLLSFRNDIYGRDRRVYQALYKP